MGSKLAFVLPSSLCLLLCFFFVSSTGYKQNSHPFAELEAYSCVMSAFRAQGALDDTKVRFLSECRQLLNISEERHKAEARRVANDERSCTVAEM